MAESNVDVKIEYRNKEELLLLGQELMLEQVGVENKAIGLFSNLARVISARSRELFLTIFGDYSYTPKNSFSYRQQKKILNYLEAMVLTYNAQFKDKQKIKFTDYDPQYLATMPKDFQELRFRILKGRTNIQAAEESLSILQNSKKQLAVKYLNQQAYEFDRVKYNSLAWGMLVGATVNATVYRRGNNIRKTALFIAFGHIFAIYAYRNNINRYFDGVYPIFRQEAVQYTVAQREAFDGWQPEGKCDIDG